MPWASGALLPGPGRLAGPRAGLVRQDGGQVAVGEPAGRGGLPERLVHRAGPVQGGQLHRLGHLGPDPGCAGGRCLGQPQPGAVPDTQEPGFGCGPRLRRAVQRARRRRRVVRVVDPRAARRGHQVPGHLGRAGRPGMGDHDLLAVTAHPHRLPGQLVRHRVLAALKGHQRQGVDLAGHPERRGERRGRDRVQPGPLLGQHLRRGTAGDPVRPGVDLPAEHLHAASSSAKLAYSGSRFASVGTRSAFAIFTVDSDPPLEAGSYGTHVATVSP